MSLHCSTCPVKPTRPYLLSSCLWFLPARLQLTFSSCTGNMTSQLQNLEKQTTRAQHFPSGQKDNLNQMAAYCVVDKCRALSRKRFLYGLAVPYNFRPADQVTIEFKHTATNCVSLPTTMSHLCKPSVCEYIFLSVSQQLSMSVDPHRSHQHCQNHGTLCLPITRTVSANVNPLCACSLCRPVSVSRPLEESPNSVTTMAPVACP